MSSSAVASSDVSTSAEAAYNVTITSTPDMGPTDMVFVPSPLGRRMSGAPVRLSLRRREQMPSPFAGFDGSVADDVPCQKIPMRALPPKMPPRSRSASSALSPSHSKLSPIRPLSSSVSLEALQLPPVREQERLNTIVDAQQAQASATAAGSGESSCSSEGDYASQLLHKWRVVCAHSEQNEALLRKVSAFWRDYSQLTEQHSNDMMLLAQRHCAEISSLCSPPAGDTTASQTSSSVPRRRSLFVRRKSSQVRDSATKTPPPTQGATEVMEVAVHAMQTLSTLAAEKRHLASRLRMHLAHTEETIRKCTSAREGCFETAKVAQRQLSSAKEAMLKAKKNAESLLHEVFGDSFSAEHDEISSESVGMLTRLRRLRSRGREDDEPLTNFRRKATPPMSPGPDTSIPLVHNVLRDQHCERFCAAPRKAQERLIDALSTYQCTISSLSAWQSSYVTDQQKELAELQRADRDVLHETRLSLLRLCDETARIEEGAALRLQLLRKRVEEIDESRDIREFVRTCISRYGLPPAQRHFSYELPVLPDDLIQITPMHASKQEQQASATRAIWRGCLATGPSGAPVHVSDSSATVSTQETVTPSSSTVSTVSPTVSAVSTSHDHTNRDHVAPAESLTVPPLGLSARTSMRTSVDWSRTSTMLTEASDVGDFSDIQHLADIDEDDARLALYFGDSEALNSSGLSELNASHNASSVSLHSSSSHSTNHGTGHSANNGSTRDKDELRQAALLRLPALSEIMLNPRLRHVFHAFLQDALCSENFYVLSESEALATMPPSLVPRQARRMFQRFVAPKAKERLNLPSSIFRQIEERLQEIGVVGERQRSDSEVAAEAASVELLRRAFDEALDCVRGLLATDSIPRFVQSKHYMQYLRELRDVLRAAGASHSPRGGSPPAARSKVRRFFGR